MQSLLVSVISAALAIGVMVITVSKAKVFAPARAALERQRLYWVHDMVSCPYCFSHWVAAFAQAWFQFTFTTTWAPVDLFIGWLTLVALGNGVAIVLYRGYKGGDE